ncbi:hypothetical protein COU17_01005 [Candidatus Kaiserbacteria bacterium CG10_big_fil_rev_8_21_14_0_10_49_17]|uniref:Glycosyltransferase 2-like domain-containing protein n=1 Tax=Candidatus Kaiserbacteria bacterium CG10_big_fil_rev_8_21_14_0_10_49_17 TaxID=1974609 RepID=A0A2M6WF14_9BACT|nr:MAG: hypothetical protein COU17_01005 [Candidatus Kaiserbacteria bacterium CG10_big_fil_rev_8_21_14_0_10_49_17]
MEGVSNVLMHAFLFVSLYFEVFLLIAFLERHVDAKDIVPKKITRYPSVAVIVPCFNEERTIAATIRSLLALQYPKSKLEIILVDDGSTDGSASILQRFANRYSHVRFIQKENGGKHSAMNTAFNTTTAELIGCLDADSFVAPDALMEIVRHFENSSVAAVTPAIVVESADNPLRLIQRAEYSLSIFIRRAFALVDGVFITPGPFSFFRRSAILSVGSWKKAYNTEDLEMGLRLQKAGMRIENAPTARVATTTPATLRLLYKQRVRWTYGFLKNAFIYREMFGNPRYGALGLVILPTATLSIFAALYFAGYFIWSTAVWLLQKLVEVQVVGISVGVPRFELFYVNTQSLIFIVWMLIAITLALIFIGKTLTNERRLSWDIPLYLALYGFLAPLWLAGALVRATISRDASWR